MRLGYTYFDDEWTSRARTHLTATFICRPGAPGQLLSIGPVSPEVLHAVTLARELEDFIMRTRLSVQTPYDKKDNPFVWTPSRPPNVFCSDSTVVNVRSRRTCTARHPHIVFIPFFCPFGRITMRNLLILFSSADLISENFACHQVLQ